MKQDQFENLVLKNIESEKEIKADHFQNRSISNMGERVKGKG